MVDVETRSGHLKERLGDSIQSLMRCGRSRPQQDGGRRWLFEAFACALKELTLPTECAADGTVGTE